MARPPTAPTSSSAPARPSTNLFPLSSHVATSSSPRTTDDSGFASHASSLSRALASVDALNVRLEWVERLCAPSIPLELMRDALGFLDVTSYDDLVEERWSEGMCSYPPCGRKAGGAYVSSVDDGGRVKVRIQAGSLQVVGSDGYCTNKCDARSTWYRSMLGTERKELLEDVERRRREVVASTGVKRVVVPEVGIPEAVEPEPIVEEVIPEALLQKLTIRERPTPAIAPSAPSAASGSMSFERPRSAYAPSPSILSHLPVEPPRISTPSKATPPRARIRPSPGSLPPTSPLPISSPSPSPSRASIFPDSMQGLPPPIFSTPEREDDQEWGEKLGVDGVEVGDEVRRGFVEALRLRKEEELAQAAEKRFEEEG